MVDGTTLRGLTEGDCFVGPACRLIDSVLAWYGGIVQ